MTAPAGAAGRDPSHPQCERNDSADHITVLDLALAQLPASVRARVLVRADSGGGTKAFLAHIVELGLQFSVGIGTVIGVDRVLLTRLPRAAWSAAYDRDGEPRDGAEVAELTGLLPGLTARGWPAGRCKYTLASNGETTPPWGVPVTEARTTPSAATPARSIARSSPSMA